MSPSVALKLLAPTVVALAMPCTLQAQEGSPPAEVTFSKDIAPILQRSCQRCHRPGGVAPRIQPSTPSTTPGMLRLGQ